jgi:hypothetical protein
MRVVRNAIRMRYTFLPYWYTVFYNTYKDGGPVMQPLWAEYPEDKLTYKMDDQYLIGRLFKSLYTETIRNMDEKNMREILYVIVILCYCKLRISAV